MAPKYLEQVRARRRPLSRFQGAWWFSCQRTFRLFCLQLCVMAECCKHETLKKIFTTEVLEHRTGKGLGLRA